jgi:RNA polymerase sigma-54 factor
MAVSIKLGLQQTQKLALTQSLMQSIELLQLSTLELAELLAQELVENPVLEEEPQSSQPGEGDGRDLYTGVSRMLSGDDSISNRIDDRESEYADTGDGAYGGEVDDTDRKRKYIENIEAGQETLTEHLLSQARIAASDKNEYILLERIITSLDPSGLLYTGIDEFAREAGLDTEEVQTHQCR